MHLASALAAAIGFGLPVGIAAQEQAAAEGLEEIIVTARRREENLQQVPVSIEAVTGEEMEGTGCLRH